MLFQSNDLRRRVPTMDFNPRMNIANWEKLGRSLNPERKLTEQELIAQLALAKMDI